MKKLLVAVMASAVLGAPLVLSTEALAAPAAAPAAQQSAPSKKIFKRRAKRAPRHAKTVAAASAPALAAVPDGEKWACLESHVLYIKGDMKRDQILTMNWDGRNYKLPRIPTTTGADRFYDPASGMDLVVIPVKAMLFNDQGDRARLADGCQTREMAENHTPAPTQSNALIRNP